ncbi:MAG TPA: hypothetical protein VGJ22_11050, partial [Anaerolineales bacterium]
MTTTHPEVDQEATPQPKQSVLRREKAVKQAGEPAYEDLDAVLRNGSRYGLGVPSAYSTTDLLGLLLLHKDLLSQRRENLLTI